MLSVHSLPGGRCRSVSVGRYRSIVTPSHTPDAQTFRDVVGAVARPVPDQQIGAIVAGADAPLAVHPRIDAVEARSAVVVGRHACANAAVASVVAGDRRTAWPSTDVQGKGKGRKRE